MRIDEDAFLRALLPRLAGDPALVVPPGDDCAALAGGRDELLLVAVDQVADDVHYYGPAAAVPTSPTLAGRKLLARNLSDIAAMGGTPRFALLALALPRDRERDWLDAFMDGLLALADEWGVRLIGGDLGRASGGAVSSLTILGTVPAAQVCRRNQARPGDRLLVTGRFGGALASGRHLSFTPRLREARWLAEGGYTRCLIDVSDGLLKDLGRVCAASGVQAVVAADAPPRAAVGGEPVTVAAAWTDGEDYELIAAVAPAKMAALRRAWPFETPLTELGECRAAVAGQPAIVAPDGSPVAACFPPTFDHFAE